MGVRHTRVRSSSGMAVDCASSWGVRNRALGAKDTYENVRLLRERQERARCYPSILLVTGLEAGKGLGCVGGGILWAQPGAARSVQAQDPRVRHPARQEGGCDASQGRKGAQEIKSHPGKTCDHQSRLQHFHYSTADNVAGQGSRFKPGDTLVDHGSCM